MPRGRSLSPRHSQPTVSFASRTRDEKPVCHKCGRAGHITYFLRVEKGHNRKKEMALRREDRTDERKKNRQDDKRNIAERIDEMIGEAIEKLLRETIVEWPKKCKVAENRINTWAAAPVYQSTF